MSLATIDQTAISRRALFRSGAFAAAGASLLSLPFGRQLLAHDVAVAFPKIAALCEKYVSEGKVANLMATIGWGTDQDHVHRIGGGNLSIRGDTEVDENTIYRIYSMSKPITGMAIMMLIDDGVLTLDQPLHDVIPAFSDMQVLVDPEGSLDDVVPVATPITMRHLLTHTAGLGYGIVSKGPLGAAFNELGLVGGRVSRNPIPGIPPVTPAPDLEVWTDRLATLPLMYQPATTWSYSCSIDLLGRVVEVASGMGFEEFLKARLFEPLGMTSTWMTVPESEGYRLTDNYGIAFGVPMPIDPAANSVYFDEPKVPAGGGGLASTPKDYDRFLRMLLGYGQLDGTRVMSEEAVRVGTSNLLPESVDLSGSWIAGQGHGAGGRSFNGTFGWGGAAGTLAAVDYNLGLRGGLWTQYMPTEAFPIRDEYLAALEADLTAMRKARGA